MFRVSGNQNIKILCVFTSHNWHTKPRLKNKKLEVENLMSHNNINILCMQEVDIESNYDPEVLNIKDYNFELEVNSLKSRTGIYVSKSILYRRMKNLEGLYSNLFYPSAFPTTWSRLKSYHY